MGDFSGTTSVHVPIDALFAYLSDVDNLPRYFARMTSAVPGEGDSVMTTATMPDGTEVQGEAWFRVDRATRRIEWGSEGPSAYSGHLQLTPDGQGSEVEVRLHTTRVPDGDREVSDGIRETLTAIKAQAESRG
jgi:uncharacterized membrane protein